jgi:sarcosine oxidase subunit beta
MSPDRQPIYDKSEYVDGLYTACGFSGHGFMFGPITGRAMADMILNQPTGLDVSCLSLKRFETGELMFEPSVV